ncbi:MAG: virulence factor BrkB family protein [Gammaproteobacteria bacterium]|nr:virulence factor BrkB family protein [Gammaproteobacteria bacterium]
MKPWVALKNIDWKGIKQKLPGQMQCAIKFLKHFIKRCADDRINIMAGHLTYVSLLSLVPLVAVIFAMFAAFPMFEEMRRSVEEAILANLIPTSGEAIQEYLNRFVGNANQMTVIGAIFLFVVAIMMINAIDKAMNTIWRAHNKRRLIISLAIYWMVITLGPLLVGTGIGLSSYLLSIAAFADEYVGGLRNTLLAMFPFFMSLMAFMLLYVMVPNKVVRFRHAIWGAAVAAFLFEMAKRGFAMYLQYFPSYELIYGAMATIPILIVWIYLSWNIILIGAELSVSIEEFFQEESEEIPPEELDEEAKAKS